MLIELPLATNVKYFDYVVYYLEAKGIKPIIAHPERYKCVQKIQILSKNTLKRDA